MRIRTALTVLTLVALAALAILVACSGGGSSPSRTSTTGQVTTTVSDPATCSAPQGPYSHIYVAVADVKIHQSATANPTDSGWVDLTPNLTPTQIDLLGTANTTCFLATLGSNVALTAGNYQQIRIFLVDNSKASSVPNNACGSAANCVVLGTNTPQPLQLSSESTTGIKIAPGQIAGGQFTINAGESRDLNLDFNACASIVVQGNSGGYSLKPVLHAGEVSLNASSISGKVVDSVRNAPISGGKVVVALEQLDTSTGIDRVIMETVPDAAGNFAFCPVPDGTYDVVAVAIDGQNIAYGATITTGVKPGNAVGTVPLVATTGNSTAPATVTGQITTANGSTGVAANISLSTLQSITVGGNTVLVTVPQAATSSATLSLATIPDASCPNADCVTYSVQVPALNPSVGAWAATGATYTSASGAVTYTLDALAFKPNSGPAFCSPSELKSTTPLTVTAGATVNAPVFAFTGCQ